MITLYTSYVFIYIKICLCLSYYKNDLKKISSLCVHCLGLHYKTRKKKKLSDSFSTCIWFARLMDLGPFYTSKFDYYKFHFLISYYSLSFNLFCNTLFFRGKKSIVQSWKIKIVSITRIWKQRMNFVHSVTYMHKFIW